VNTTTVEKMTYPLRDEVGASLSDEAPISAIVLRAELKDHVFDHYADSVWSLKKNYKQVRRD